MLLENVILALTGLMANKLRTVLTMLGIVIGIASVIAIMAVGDGMNKSVTESMGSMGANSVSVYLSQKPNEDGSYDENVRDPKASEMLTVDMANDLEKNLKGTIDGVSISKELSSMKITVKNKYANIALTGVNTTAYNQAKLKILAGRSFVDDEYESGRKVILVSDKYVTNMYNGNNASALGQTVEITYGNRFDTFTIIGVYEYSMSSTGYSAGVSQKDMSTPVYMPLNAALQLDRTNQGFDSLNVIASSSAGPDAAATAVQDYINNKYYKNNDVYQVEAYSMKAEVDQMKSMTSTMTYAFMGIGAISLLVGGIGVMNIMVVTITERTREIGTRKALGATNGQIRLQFITEAIVICVLGGLIGVVLGIGLGAIISKAMNYSGMASPLGIAACVLFSVFFGVFFGYYPANKAAKMNPIEALRYE